MALAVIAAIVVGYVAYDKLHSWLWGLVGAGATYFIVKGFA